VLHNPLGYNRVYVHVEGELTYEKWWENFKQGRVVVTNGPLLRPRVNGELPGHVFVGEPGDQIELEATLDLTTRDPIDYLEMIVNGRMVEAVHLNRWAKEKGKLPKVKFTESGWYLIRAVSSNQKTFRFASTGPYYVQIGYQRRISKKSAQFFAAWVRERIGRIKLEDPDQRREVLEPHEHALQYWEGLVAKANAE
jgi:hypothetical protein